MLYTTVDSLARHKSNIRYNDLPRPFPNAIFLTQTLGVGHIWIDSLSILQGDDEH